MKDTSKLLPIGSVVLLNNGTKTVMVTGFYSVAANDTKTVYDYCGCLFPEGVLSSEQNLLFNHNQIMKVCYMGYTSEEEKSFKVKLGEIVSKMDSEPVAETPAPSEPAVETSTPVAEPIVETPAPAQEVQIEYGTVTDTPAAEPVAPTPEVVEQPATTTDTSTTETLDSNEVPSEVTISY